jgi:ABC-2 type transport system ATP-binding protein
LEQRRRGTTVVFSSHIVPDVEAVADRVAILRQGRLAEVKDLRRRPPARTFRAVIGVPTGGGVVARRLDAAEVCVTVRERERWTVDVVGVAVFGAFLQACAAEGVAVHDVQPGAGDLESEFLAGLGAAGPQEVVG